MPTKIITVPRTYYNLDSDEKSIYFALPEHLQEQFIRSLPPLEVTPRQASANRKLQIAISERIETLEALKKETEQRLRELRLLWQRLENNQAANLAPIHHPPQVEGMTVRYERRRRQELNGSS